MFTTPVCKFAVLDTKTIYLDKHLALLCHTGCFCHSLTKGTWYASTIISTVSFLQSLLITSFTSPSLVVEEPHLQKFSKCDILWHTCMYDLLLREWLNSMPMSSSHAHITTYLLSPRFWSIFTWRLLCTVCLLRDPASNTSWWVIGIKTVQKYPEH